MKTSSKKHTKRRERSQKQLGLLAGLLFAGSCTPAMEPVTLNQGTATTAAPGQIAEYLVGQDGDYIVTKANEVLNTYSNLGTAAKAGDKSITVANAADLKNPLNMMALKKGDLLMVYQAQGATIDTTEDAKKYGSVTALNNTGRYEFVTVDTVAGNVITLGATCGGLRNSYAATSQVLRVPQFNKLTVNTGSSVVAKPWDGTNGGIVALHVLTDTSIGGSINVLAQGFRGGQKDDQSNTAGSAKVTTMASKMMTQGAEKGESIAGSALTYDGLTGRYGRGSAANGGGGGNAHNAGGGGGAGGGDVKLWTGHGVMDPAAVGGATAWKLDQAYKDNGNALTTSTGGGRGGYTYSRLAAAGAADPLVDAPGSTKWGGDNRQDVGGLGGHPIDPVPGFEMFFGGGGGAGDQDSASGGSGGTGGGVVILVSNSVTVPAGGLGQINASGGDGAATGNSHTDGAGGGGGGGAIFILNGKSLDPTLKLTAAGGLGGNQVDPMLADPLEADGTGGGGGGGVVVYMAGSTAVTQVVGRVPGTSQADSVKGFPVNGATKGNNGTVVVAPRQPMVAGMPGYYPICLPADIQTSITSPVGMVQPGTNADFTVKVSNAGENPALGADVTTMLPAGIDPSKITWTCTAMGGAMCPANMGTGALPPQADLPVGSSLSYKVSVPVPAGTMMPTINLGVSAQPPPGYTDPMPMNNSATGMAPVAGVVVKPTNADLQVNVTKSPTSPNPGDETTINVTAKNNGPDAAGKPVVVFTIPPGSTVTMPPPAAGDPNWDCTANGGTYTCVAKMDLPSGGTTPPIVVKFKTPPDTGMNTGTPQVAVNVGSPSVNDPNPVNNSTVVDVGPTKPSPTADLSLTITKTPASNGPGMETTFTAQPSNKGPDKAQNPTVTFEIPAGSTVTQPPMGSGWSCTRTNVTVTCVTAEMPPGDAPPITLKIIAPTPMPADGPAGSVAGVISSPSTRDPNPANNQDSKPIAPATAPTGSDLSVKISSDNPNPKPGDTVTITGVATNKGPDSVKDPVVVFNLPPGAEVIQPAQGTGWTCTQTGTTAICTRPTAELGDAPPITVKVRYPQTPAGSTPPAAPTTSVVVSAPNNKDPDPTNNTSVIDTRPTGPRTNADLALSITKSPESAGTGTETTYTLQTTNKGPGTVTNPSVTFSIPPGSTVTQPPAGQGWQCLQRDVDYTCYLNGTLPPGEAAPITIKVNTPAPADPAKNPGAVAGVVSSPSNDDPNLLNNTASVPVVTTKPTGSDLSVKISQSPTSPAPGSDVVYTGQASNGGPDPVNNPVIVITLPPGAEVTEEPSGTGWNCTRDVSTVICTRDSINQGAAPPVTVKVRLPKDGAVGGPVTAVVNAPNNNDPKLDNNVATTELLRLFGGGFGCSAAGHGPQQAAGGTMLLGAALALLLGLRRRTALRA